MADPTIDARRAAITATHSHDAGAYARCSYCGRYSDDIRSLEHKIPCDCGKTEGWCGSFLRPGPKAVWSSNRG